MAYRDEGTVRHGMFRTYRSHTNPSGSTSQLFTAYYNTVKAGSKVDDHRKKIALGINASSNYEREFATLTSSVYQCHSQHRTLPSNWRSTVSNHVAGFDTSLIPQYLPKAETDALRRLTNKVRDAIVDWEAGVFAAEAKDAKRLLGMQTVRAVNHFLQGKRSLKLALRKMLYSPRLERRDNRWGRAHIYRPNHRQIKENLASEWLGICFGAAPMLKDISEAFGVFGEGAKSGTPVIRASGYVTDTVSETFHTGGNGHLWMHGCQTMRQAVVRYTVRPYLDVGIPGRYGIRPRDIPVSVWNGIPWSFLFDYFYDVGGFLESLTIADVRLKYGAKATLTRNYTHITTTITESSPSVYEVMSSSSGKALWRRVKYARSILSEMPLYTPRLTIAEPFSDIRAVNMAALLGAIRLPRND